MTSKHSLLSLLLLGLIAVGCSVDDSSGSGSSEEKIVIAPKCSGVPTPMCAPGTKLVDSNGDGCDDACEPIACPPFMPTCKPGEKIADTDGDGCALECAACPAILCQAGTEPADYDGDGCDEACKPIGCPPFMPTCKPGEKIADTDGDGCALECAACPAILCEAGTKQVDSDGDGCEDTCEPIACPPVVPNCKPGEKVADTNGDGCALECE